MATYSTVRSLQHWGENALSTTSTNHATASQAAALLLMHVLSYDTYSDLVLHAHARVPYAKEIKYKTLLRRRGKGEPVQYIIGSVAFMDLELKISKACLIPRPETELLVEHVLHYARTLNGPYNILDIGTGCGNIAIALAFYLKRVKIDAVDISNKALAIARRNATHYQSGHVISFYHGVLFDAVPQKKRYTIIVSNPPYVTAEEVLTGQPELQWEPRQALIANEDGREIIERIITNAYPRLKTHGALFLEIGHTHGKHVKASLKKRGYKNVNILKDLSNQDRIAYGFKE